ncbi:MAG: deoxyribodipyrimidine photo-lyase [bacterium]
MNTQTKRLDVNNLFISSPPKEVDRLRIRTLKDAEIKDGPIAYWMSRDQRVDDNWALLYAQEVALKLKRPLYVLFCLVPDFLQATIRQYAFMLKGLQEVEGRLTHFNIDFFILPGNPQKQIPHFIKKEKIALLVTDFDPLKIKINWKNGVTSRVNIPVCEVDAHNIVPCWIASNKEEIAAYSIRQKILKLLPRFLTEFPKVKPHPFGSSVPKRRIDYNHLFKTLKVDSSVPEVNWLKPAETGAKAMLRGFVKGKLQRYHVDRNDPSLDSVSNLSPYLHFGNISAQRVAIEAIRLPAPEESKSSFLEELIIRRELSDNFCFYNKNYDSIDAARTWARETLENHRKDKRPYVYDLEDLEEAKTHDDSWNAAQLELLIKGKMHPYMRMYWAKKILEWTESPEKALEIAIYLNDKYELDGRDPNGYTGIAWSILGIHDRPFMERPIFGQIRYMSYSGLSKKFDIRGYIAKVKTRGDK